MRRTGFGVIGCGAVSALHARGILGCPEAKFVGCADMNPARAAEFAREYGGRAFADMDALLASGEVDAVCVCVPSGLHAEVSLRALRAGKHVLVEKPLALTVEDADAMIEAANAADRQIGVVSQFRFSEAFLAAKRAVDAGALGRLVMADALMRYSRTPDYYAKSAWRGTYRMDGGGALMNQGVHGVDALLALMGDVRSVYGLCKTLRHDIEVEDTAAAVVEFQSGALGAIEATTSIKPGYPRRFQVSGTLGSLTIVEDAVAAWDVPGVPAPTLAAAPAKSGASEPMNIDEYGHAMHIRDMARVALTGGAPVVNARDGRRAVALIRAIYASSRAGTRIDMTDPT